MGSFRHSVILKNYRFSVMNTSFKGKATVQQGKAYKFSFL